MVKKTSQKQGGPAPSWLWQHWEGSSDARGCRRAPRGCSPAPPWDPARSAVRGRLGTHSSSLCVLEIGSKFDQKSDNWASGWLVVETMVNSGFSRFSNFLYYCLCEGKLSREKDCTVMCRKPVDSEFHRLTEPICFNFQVFHLIRDEGSKCIHPGSPFSAAFQLLHRCDPLWM